MNIHALVASLLISSTALAESPALVTHPPGEDKIVAIKRGEPAPFAGQLYDTDTALRWASWLQQYKKLYALDLQAAGARCQVQVDYQKELARIEQVRGQAVAEDLRTRLRASEAARVKAEDELRDPGFFRQPGVWFAGGVLFTVAVAAGGAALITAVK